MDSWKVKRSKRDLCNSINDNINSNNGNGCELMIIYVMA